MTTQENRTNRKANGFQIIKMYNCIGIDKSPQLHRKSRRHSDVPEERQKCEGGIKSVGLCARIQVKQVRGHQEQTVAWRRVCGRLKHVTKR